MLYHGGHFLIVSLLCILCMKMAGTGDNECKKKEMYKREEILHQYGSLKAKLQYSNVTIICVRYGYGGDQAGEIPGSACICRPDLF